MARARVHQIDGELKNMTSEELRNLMDDDNLQIFFQTHGSIVQERHTLIQDVKKENVRLARINVAQAGELTKLNSEVAQLRDHVRSRQQELQPLEKRVRGMQERDTNRGVMERLTQEIADLQRETLAMAENIAQTGESDKSLQAYIQAREKLHMKMEILERLQQQK